jgi:hypothetical protein
MDSAAIWLLRMFLKLLNFLDLNSLAGLLVKDVYECREAKIFLFGGQIDSTIACEASLGVGYALWVTVLVSSYLAYKRCKN